MSDEFSPRPAPRSDLTWFFFRLKGRVNRQAFLLGGLLIGVVQAFPLYQYTRVMQDSAEAQGWAALTSAVLLVSLWPSVALGAKRLQDINKPAIGAISLLVPFINGIAFIVLCLVPGTKGPNAYGEQTNAPP
ncbi:MAG: DUF805 domain-containing protein [Mesorhizobium amorphae]|nr:MAG: DUF805 domain-containing protein [Mesorhizobium amorphae]